MIDDSKYGVNPHPNDCVHTGFAGLCPACRAGVHPGLTDSEKIELSKLSEWEKLYQTCRIIREKCLGYSVKKEEENGK